MQTAQEKQKELAKAFDAVAITPLAEAICNTKQFIIDSLKQDKEHLIDADFIKRKKMFLLSMQKEFDKLNRIVGRFANWGVK